MTPAPLQYTLFDDASPMWPRKGYPLEVYQNIAHEHGGECLSAEYINSKTKLRFRCSKGHEFEARPESIKYRNTWCPICAGVRIQNPLGDVQRMAVLNGGECLSTEYINSKTKLRFRCADGHEWEAAPSSIVKVRSWCPRCANRTESLFRQFLECVFDAEFREAAPKWLNKDRPRQYRLDGYNANLQIAFEYHGDQHYRHVSLFHRNGKTLENQVARDRHVREQCKAHGITLLEFETVPVGCSQESFIALARRPVEALLGHQIGDEALERFMSRPFGVSRLQLFRKIARDNGGVCLSIKYLGNAVPLHFRCANGHEWHAKPMHIKNSESWCPVCAGVRIQNPLTEVQDIARRQGGKCLSAEYQNTKAKLRFRCANGHEWTTAAANVLRRGSWCPICAGKAVADYIGEMKKTAELKGGMCLTEETKCTSATKLKFRCKEGHEWVTTAGSIKYAGSWCPICSGHKIIDPLDKIRAIAEANEGECLSSVYEGSKRKMRFRCRLGHEWETTPNGIMTGHWCPRCASVIRVEKTAATKKAKKTQPLSC